MLVRDLKRVIKDHQLWGEREKILIAVSTGVDSMVLLHALEQLQESGLRIGVAHLNHQLRLIADEEEFFLREYCETRGIPFYCQRWLTPVTTNIEAQARAFRYTFFKEVMEEEAYSVLVTAHHSEDQMETMLMKMIRTGELFSSQGIALSQPFASGRLIRPFLFQSKETLLQYAEENSLVYYEDETNQTLDFQRNRLRHQVLPVLKGENPQALKHFQQLSEQIQRLEAWVEEEQASLVKKAIKREKNQLILDLAYYPFDSTVKQTFLFADIVKKAYASFNLVISKKQITQVLQLLDTGKTQWHIDLEAGWCFTRSYQKLVLQKKRTKEKLATSHDLSIGRGVYLDEETWVGIFLPEKLKVPEKVKNWSEFRQELVLESEMGLTVGPRRQGERIALAPDLNKKIARYFIDEKIPTEQREEAWILRDGHKKVLALLPYMLSYLSIREETDKIHYVLLFKYRK